MDSCDPQLKTKYQKIATEYSKIRAQANVLKKAIVDEQARNADVKDQLKEREVELRRAEQELDSLSFRNQQLTKRITVLQEELDKTQNKTKKGKSKLSDGISQIPVASPNHILDEEFQKKIVENARLLSEISNKDSEIENLTEKLQQLENKLDYCKQSKDDTQARYRDMLDKIEKEKNELQRKLNECQNHEGTVAWVSHQNKSDESGIESKAIQQYDEIESSLSTPSKAASRFSKGTLDITTLKTAEIPSSNNSEKMYEMEKELNQWKAQYHTLKIKYDQLEQKECIGYNILENDGTQHMEINNMVGQILVPFSLPEEIEAREAKIRDYFLQEIDRLSMEKYIGHVKNLSLAANNEVLQIHLDTSEAKREESESALTEALSNYISLQKDKETQEGNYKAQLSTMSEHLANMNEKLISQTEEIQQLKYELSNKGSKKGKQK